MNEKKFIFEDSFYIRFYSSNTFIQSFLYIFDKFFKIRKDNIDTIRSVKKQLLNELPNFWKKYKRFRKYKRKILENNLLNPDSNIDKIDELKKYICDYFSINIILINEFGSYTGSFYTGEEFDKSMTTLLFLETINGYKKYYSPVFINNNAIFKIENVGLIEELYENNIKNHKKNSRTFTKLS